MNTSTLEKPKEGLGGVGQETIDEMEGASPAVKRDLGIRKMIEEKIGRGAHRIYSERMTVTPTIARILLERNKDNRRLRPVKIKQLISDMNNHKFKLNGEPIIIAKTGELNDGQHRLTAIVESNRQQDMLITYGVERDTRDTIDTGVNRTAGDVLGMTGVTYGSNIAALSRMILSYERNHKKFLGRTGDISAQEVLSRARKDNLLVDAVTYTYSHLPKFKRFAKGSIIAFCYYWFAVESGSPAKAKTFMEQIREGRELKSNSPAYVVREYLSTRPKLTTVDKIECLIKSWNAWIKDDEIKVFKLTGVLPKIEG